MTKRAHTQTAKNVEAKRLSISYICMYVYTNCIKFIIIIWLENAWHANDSYEKLNGGTQQEQADTGTIFSSCKL